jgi:hypothetical protein
MERWIEVSTTSRVAFTMARQVLQDDPGAVLSEGSATEAATNHFLIDLGIDLGRGTSVHQQATISLGEARATATKLFLPVCWQATGREAVLPSFEGELEASKADAGTELRLVGSYAVPLGVIGRFGDGVIGRRLARQSLGALVERLAGRLEAEMARREDSVIWHEGRSPVSPNESQHSEIYVG